MTLRRKLLATVATLAVLAVPSWSHAQNQKLLLNTFIGVNHPITTQILKPWADDIAKATEGRVTIDIAPTSLAAPPQQLDGVTKGVFDMAYQFHGFLAPKVKLTNVAHLPFVNTTSKGSSVALWRTYEKFFAQANELPDVHVLGMFVALPGPIFSMKAPIQSIADVKGTKMYALPGVPARMFEAAGAGVVAAPAVRSHEIISGGTVDSFAGYSVMDAEAFKTLQYAKEVVDLPGHLTAPAFALFVNKRKWNAIAAKDKEAITRLSGEALSARFSAYDANEARIRAEAKAKGLVFKEASPQFVAELKKLGDPLEAAWLADAASLGVDGKAALAFFKEEAVKNAR
jgi:TRAP-type C4-dicarboxylate transport system substrate-binding protein